MESPIIRTPGKFCSAERRIFGFNKIKVPMVLTWRKKFLLEFVILKLIFIQLLKNPIDNPPKTLHQRSLQEFIISDITNNLCHIWKIN